MYDHYYNRQSEKAEPIAELIAKFAANGTEGVDAAGTQELSFSAAEWNSWDEAKREQILQNYRLAYRADTMVNWCPQLGTVLANDEVKDGLSVRGGHPVEQKRMKQWLLRVTAYAQRMLDAGASLVQCYSAMIYEGPALPGRICRQMAAPAIAAEKAQKSKKRQ